MNASHLKLISFTAIFVILAFLTGCKRTASPTASPQPVSSSLDVVKIKTDKVGIAADGNADAMIVLTISPGFHINANPATFPYLIATEVEIGNGYGMLTAGKPVYPSAEKKQFSFAEQPLAVYEGAAKITLPLHAAPTKGSVSLPISVTVQACDEEKCYPPGRLNAMIPVEVK